uniref:Mitochondrial inheritance component mdm10 n=1 Tax=Colletotrichum fructicola (strain Nara gc5) TaxID=1213859 RepID=L2G1P2_COLFN
MGNISASYAGVAGRHCSLATRMDFNVYSYESDWSVGMELWRKNLLRSDLDQQQQQQQQHPALSAENFLKKERSFQAKMERRWSGDWTIQRRWTTRTMPGGAPGAGAVDDEYTSVIKARIDQHMKIGVLWEGRVKSLLFSLGSAIDLRKLDSPFRTLGVEIQFSS